MHIYILYTGPDTRLFISEIGAYSIAVVVVEKSTLKKKIVLYKKPSV